MVRYIPALVASLRHCDPPHYLTYCRAEHPIGRGTRDAPVGGRDNQLDSGAVRPFRPVGPGAYHPLSPAASPDRQYLRAYLHRLPRGRLSYPELVGASIVAGASVVLLSALGLTARLAAWIPAPIVLGLLAGAVMPFVSDIFTSLGDAPALVGGTVLVYFVSRRVLGSRLPAILPALVAGLAIAALTGEIGQVPARLSLPIPSVTNPVFSVHAIATATPVLVILIALQSNLPSVVFLQNEGYHPPERVINNVSGVSTLLGSLLGPTAVSLSLPATALVAGPQAGEHQLRHRAVYLASGAVLLIALLAGIAADLPALIPLRLLFALAGLAVVDLLAHALLQITRGPLLLGPMFAFAIALSEISILGFGPFFWALVIGTGISFLLERDKLQELRSPVPAGEERSGS